MGGLSLSLQTTSPFGFTYHGHSLFLGDSDSSLAGAAFTAAITYRSTARSGRDRGRGQDRNGLGSSRSDGNSGGRGMLLNGIGCLGSL
jgi:hypothetical protein